MWPKINRENRKQISLTKENENQLELTKKLKGVQSTITHFKESFNHKAHRVSH